MYVNLTPHPIVVRTPSGDTTFPPSGQLARVDTREETGHQAGEYPAVRRLLGVVQIPVSVDPSAVLIVSSMVLEAARAEDHPDLHRMAAPDTGPTAIREGGQVKAVTRFVVA